ncbi:hypothetical protein JST97_17900 [bacterium]|nr:hypothetical protein [bacterium]
MKSKIFGASLVAAILIAGCGNDNDEFDKGNPNNYPIINNSSPNGQPSNPSAPVVTLDTGILATTRASAATAFAPGATVSDADTAALNGGTLTIRAGIGSGQGFSLNGPANPSIGTVTGNGTGTLTVALNGNATPAAIQQYLRGVTFASDGTSAFGPTPVTVSLSDGTGLNSQNVFRIVNVGGVAARSITVGQGGVTTIQQAVDQIAATNGAQGSSIVIPAGTYNESVNIVNDPDLSGLQLVGPNAGNSAGVSPANRAAEAVFNRLDVASPNVALRGVTISQGVDAGINEAAGVYLRSGASNFTASEDRFVRTGAPGNFRGIINAVGTTNGNLMVQSSLFQGFATGIYLQGSSTATPYTGGRITGNSFIGNTVGISGDNVQDLQITGNGFRNQTTEQIGLLNPGNTVVASGNSFDNSASLTVYTAGAGDVGNLDARNNFFNSATGPASAGNNPRVNTNGAGTYNIQTTPFLTSSPFAF